MKKYIILLILILFSAKVYPFWIWSPKTQEWKNPKYSALATPYLQYKQALKLFEEEKFKEAYQEFKKLLVHYPDAREAAEAQYYLARCLVKFDKQYEAFLEYQKLIDSYPNSQRINEVVEREYNIGEYFLNREHKKWLGLSLYDFVEHPSIEIFRSIVNKVPYSEYAPRAQYKLGIILIQLSRYEEARESFQKVIDNYSDSEWAAPAKYQLALATSKAFPGADYDSSYLSEATSRLDEFIKDHPEAKISSQAQEQLAVLRNKEARKSFDTGQFYENQDQYKSSIIYYKKVVNDYSDSSYYDLAVERTEELEGLITDNITKGDLERRDKEEAVTAKRAEKTRLKEEKIQQQQARKDQKLVGKQEIRAKKLKRKEEKIKAKQERVSRKQELKEQRRQEKIRLREEKLRKKQELRERKRKKFWFW
ncbi:MAG: outer membrane protein assembly factor BamD [Candidatus Omnitrophota bacterium]